MDELKYKRMQKRLTVLKIMLLFVGMGEMESKQPLNF